MFVRWLASCLFFLSIPSWANEKKIEPSATVEEINKKIIELEDELHQYQVQEMKKMVEGQTLFLADWEKYSDDLQKIKILDEREKKLIGEIKKLKQHKSKLLNK
jgi:hypothetical protein